MDELIKLVSERTGLSEEMAETAVETVVGFLKDRLAGPLAGQIDGVLSDTGTLGGVGGLAKNLGGILGKR